jgi:hypothetical protein
MGTVTAATLINRAGYLLEDTSNVTWTRVELLDWLNEAQSQVVTFVPTANVIRQNLTLAAGTLQTLPEGAITLMDVPRNVEGPSVRLVSREIMDAGPVDWYTYKAASVVKNYVYNNDEGGVFHVFPPNTGTGNVVIVYSKVPAVLTNEAQTISVEDTYQAALVNYMVFRAYSKDTDYADGSKASSYFGAFKDVLANKAPADAEISANRALGPANPGSEASLK